MKEELYSIGEVCRICHISTSKLRYYDEIGVIKPAKVDEENGYRYYSREVLLELPILFYLKGLGFSLKEIREALSRKDLGLLREIFTKKSAAIEEERRRAEYRKQSVDSWVELIDEWRAVFALKECPVCLKYLPRMIIYRFDPPDFRGCRYENILVNTGIPNSIVTKDQGLYSVGALYLHYPDGRRGDLKKVCPFIGFQGDSGETEVFGGFSVVSRYHRGSFDTIDETVKEMRLWAEDHNFHLRGDIIERSVIDCWSVLDEDQWLMEIYLPVEE